MNNNYDESTKLVIAYLGKPIGLKGQIKLHPQSDFLTQFKVGVKFKTDNENLTIQSFDKDKMLVKFEGYDTPEKARELSTKPLYSTIEESRKNCQLSKDEFFWFDIIACEVFENNELLGIVDDIERFTGQDYLFILTSDPLVANNMPKSFLLPYSDRHIISVDIQNKKISAQNAKDILEAS